MRNPISPGRSLLRDRPAPRPVSGCSVEPPLEPEPSPAPELLFRTRRLGGCLEITAHTEDGAEVVRVELVRPGYHVLLMGYLMDWWKEAWTCEQGPHAETPVIELRPKRKRGRPTARGVTSGGERA